MKSIILTIAGICLCFVSMVKGQDTIVMRSGDEIQAKVLEITLDELRYTMFNNPDGPTTVVSKKDVFMVKYQNGTKTVMKQNLVNKQIEPEPYMKPKKVYIQDATKFFIGYDLVKGIIDENSLTLGYKLTKYQFITASLGFTYYNESLIAEDYALSPSQEDYPIFAYQGPTFRASYNYIFNRSFYIGLDVFYKHLYYPYHTFIEQLDDEDSDYFIRSEHANVIGWHIDLGWMISPGQSKWLYINPSFGIGQTTKFRTYTNIDSWMGETYGCTRYGNSSWLPLGTFSQTQNYFSVILNLNIGVKF